MVQVLSWPVSEVRYWKVTWEVPKAPLSVNFTSRRLLIASPLGMAIRKM